MELLQKTIETINPKSQDYARKAKAHLETLTMPHWALGRLLDLAVEIASMTRCLSPDVSRKSIFIMVSDHGIAEEGVSLYPKEVTRQMVYNFINGGAAINVLSRVVGARTVVVDVGVDADLSNLSAAGAVVDAKVGRGTRNFAKEPAMTRDQAVRAVCGGIELARKFAPEVSLFGTGDMGIANTTPSAAVAAIFCGKPVEAVVGRGTGIDDGRLSHKTAVIEKALALHRPDPADPLDVLCKVGGFEIAALAGLILGAAGLKRPVVVDGYISTAAALAAHRFCPAALDYVVAAHVSAENGHSVMWEYLEKKPLLDLGLRLGEGTGAALAMNLVEAAVRILTEMATFASAGISRK